MDWSKDIFPSLILLLVAGIGTVAGWFIRSKFEESHIIRQKLNDERRKTYGDILLPLISIVANINHKENPSKAVEEIMKDLNKLQKDRLDLVLFGSDNVVLAHNAFCAYSYQVNTTETQEERGIQYMRLLGKLLLEIRRDVGNKDTKLDEIEMLRWLIKDIDKLEKPKT